MGRGEECSRIACNFDVPRSIELATLGLHGERAKGAARGRRDGREREKEAGSGSARATLGYELPHCYDCLDPRDRGVDDDRGGSWRSVNN